MVRDVMFEMQEGQHNSMACAEPGVAETLTGFQSEFGRELAALLQKHGKDTECDVPAFLLVAHFERHLKTLTETVTADTTSCHARKS